MAKSYVIVTDYEADTIPTPTPRPTERRRAARPAVEAADGPPVAVVGDITADGATITEAGQDFVYFNGHLAAIDGGVATGPNGTAPLIGGAGIVTINGKPLVRTGDPTGSGSIIITGQNNITAK